MKLTTLTYDANLPLKQQINIPTNTDYMVGVKVKLNGNELNLNPTEVTLGTLSADEEKTNGYVTFTKAAGDDASTQLLKLNVNNTALKRNFDLVENIFKSQSGDIELSGSGGGGGDTFEVIEEFGPWRFFSSNGYYYSNAVVNWYAAEEYWENNIDNDCCGWRGDLKNNIVFFTDYDNDQYPSYFAYRSHTYTFPDGTKVDATPFCNGADMNVNNTTTTRVMNLALFKTLGTNVYYDA